MFTTDFKEKSKIKIDIKKMKNPLTTDRSIIPNLFSKLVLYKIGSIENKFTQVIGMINTLITDKTLKFIITVENNIKPTFNTIRYLVTKHGGYKLEELLETYNIDYDTVYFNTLYYMYQIKLKIVEKRLEKIKNTTLKTDYESLNKTVNEIINNINVGSKTVTELISDLKNKDSNNLTQQIKSLLNKIYDELKKTNEQISIDEIIKEEKSINDIDLLFNKIIKENSENISKLNSLIQNITKWTDPKTSQPATPTQPTTPTQPATPSQPATPTQSTSTTVLSESVSPMHSDPLTTDHSKKQN